MFIIILSVILALLILLCAILSTAIFLKPWRVVSRFRDKDIPADDSLPGVSIVTYTSSDLDSLSEYLDTLLKQDYPDFEVIAVCDASAETTAMISERFSDISNLHITFIPPGSHNVSRRKLAQTIGVKAASKDVVAITSSSVTPRSDQWLRRLAAPLADESHVMSLGYINHPFSAFKGWSKWFRQFDALLSSAQWLAAAISGHPFRGDGFNLAFRRETFFRNKGYASSFSLTDGDDDIFIHDLSACGKCGVTLCDDSIVDAVATPNAKRLQAIHKERYLFTRRFLPKKPFIIASLAEWANWLVAVFAIISAIMLILIISGFAPLLSPIVNATSQLPVADHTVMMQYIITTAAISIVCIILAIAFNISEIIIYRRLARRMGAVRLFWSLIPFMLLRPFYNLRFSLHLRKSLRHHYSWHS